MRWTIAISTAVAAGTLVVGSGQPIPSPAPLPAQAPPIQAAPVQDSPAPVPAPAPVLLTHADMALAAAADINTVPQEERKNTKYLSLHNVEESRRGDAYKVMSVHVNSLSREPDITPPHIVPNTRGALLRINLLDYGIDRFKFREMADFEPYFYVTHKRLEKAAVDPSQPEKQVPVPQQKEDTDTLFAPHLADGPTEAIKAERAKVLGRLLEQTQSQTPIVRADWFFRQTAIQDDDKYDGKCPGYYDFLGLGKDTADFQALIGFEQKAIDKFKDEVAAVSSRSPVANNNRRLVRKGKIGGGYWFTLDARQNVGQRNYLRVLDGGVVNDATEQFGPLPNGLFAWWLADGNNKRQNSAPDFIAGDSTTAGTDHRVHANLSCVRCHVDGVQPIDDWVRRLIKPPLSLSVPSVDFGKAKRLRQLYASDLEEKILPDQQGYRRAVFRASLGLTTQQFVNQYEWWWNRYQESDFDLDRISLETGSPRPAVLAALNDLALKQGALDPVIAGLLRATVTNKGGKQEIAIRSEQFEEIFPLLMVSLRGGAVPDKIKTDVVKNSKR